MGAVTVKLPCVVETNMLTSYGWQICMHGSLKKPHVIQVPVLHSRVGITICLFARSSNGIDHHVDTEVVDSRDFYIDTLWLLMLGYL